MPSSNERLAILLEAWCNRSATEAEEELFALVKEDAGAEQSIQEHIEQLVVKFDTRELVPAADWEKVYQQLQEKITMNQPPASTVRHIPWRRIGVAASIILLLGISAFYLLVPRTNNAIPIADTNVPAAQKDIAPGSTGAILTLSNGKQIVLDSARSSTLLVQGSSKLMNHQGRLTYNNVPSTSGEIVYNTMTTTNGKQYQLQLSDGSKIWLNAASSITYPTAFTGNERKISITGEAYFEIAHDAKRPFTVSTNGMEVQVLGTHFNVNAYSDEENTSTTLLEGSVKISNRLTTTLLSPGQQLQLNRQGKISLINNADVQEAVAWKDGLFVMKKASIASIMRQIARWYDVEIAYSNGVPAGRISGDIPRNMNLSKVLEVMELSGVHFSVSGKRVEVKP